MDEKLFGILKCFQKKFHFEKYKTIRDLSFRLINNQNRFSINYFFESFNIYPETVLMLSILFSTFTIILTSFLIIILNNILFIFLSLFVSY